jgi:hypothetical protein
MHRPYSFGCFRFTQEDTSDPNEIYPWFISAISKQEAVDLLAKRKLTPSNYYSSQPLLFSLLKKEQCQRSHALDSAPHSDVV